MGHEKTLPIITKGNTKALKFKGLNNIVKNT